jgi:hypothetical protein
VKRAAAEPAEQFYEDDKDPEAGLVPLSVVCFVFSAVLLAVQMFGSDRITAANDSPLMVPEAQQQKWEQRSDAGWQNQFKSVLPELAQ